MRNYKFFLIPLIFVYGCGVKGSPEPPKVIIPPKIINMNIKQQGDLIVLYWQYDKNKKYVKPKVFLNGNFIKTNIYKKDNLYWIDYKIKQFNKKYCFYINTDYKGVSINSPVKCISPIK
ncbi:MAG: hypothetical protein D6834_03805, partial [Aquificota bacterium]